MTMNMKNWKKLASLALGAALSVTLLAGCGGGGATESAAPTPSAASAESKEPAASTPAESKEPADSAAPAGSEAPADPAELQTVEAGKLHMSTNAAFPPYEMVSDSGSFEGIDVDVATAIAEKLGLELVVDDMDFDAALLAAQNGQSDIVMAGVTVNKERQAVMDFSDSYAKGVQVIIVPEGSPIETVEDLAKAERIGCQAGTTGYTYCSDTPENGGFGEDHVRAFDNGATAVQALLGNQVDAVVIDNEPAKSYVAANPSLKILETAYADEDYAIGMKKGNTALLDAVNGALKELIADGTVQEIIDQYIKAE